MKKISELGLELIQLEDQVLLVDPNEDSQEGDWICWNKRAVKAIDTAYSKDTKYIIASTKPLEGLPLLVIEDEVKKLADVYGDKLTDNPAEVEDAFISGYSKSKETFKFTEEDLIKAIDMARECESDCGGVYFMGGTTEEIIQSLTKKELWVEVENYCGSPFTTERCPKCIDCCDKAYQRPKITNNQIKAVWR